MSWLYLVATILLDVAAVVALKFSEGFTRLLPSVMVFVLGGIAGIFGTLALRKIEVSIAVTICTGASTVLIALVGILCLGEQASTLKLVSIALVIAGVVGLKLSAS